MRNEIPSNQPSLADLGLDSPAAPPKTSGKISLAELQRESELEKEQHRTTQVHNRVPQQDIAMDIVAGVVSLFIPGGGHFVKGKILAGICWFIATVIGYFAFIVPGVLLHLSSIPAAVMAGREK